MSSRSGNLRSEDLVDSVEIVAHRGTGKAYTKPESGQAYRPAAPPENTLPAFEWAWARGRACELDVFLTGDGEVIVIHDATTGRTCDRDLTVSESTLHELKTLDAGVKKGEIWKGVRLPALREVLDVMPPDGRLYIELKQGPGLVEPLLAVIDQAGKDPAQIVFISFSIDSCAGLKQCRPEFSVCWNLVFQEVEPGVWRAGYDRTEEDGLTFRTVWLEPADYDELLTLARSARVDGLDVSVLQPDDFAAAMRKAGMPWGAWTVDDADVAVSLATKGAFQITSNCPDDVRGALGYLAAGRDERGRRSSRNS